MAEIEGKYDEQFKPVADALSRNLDSGADVGASVAVFIEGEPVVDIWGGYSDTDQTAGGNGTRSSTFSRPPRR